MIKSITAETDETKLADAIRIENVGVDALEATLRTMTSPMWRLAARVSADRRDEIYLRRA